MSVANVLAPVVDFVFPPRCPLCGEGVSAQAGLCASCWGQLVIPGKPACAACARPFRDGARHGPICARCEADPPLHDGIAAATIYNDASRKLVLAFKHGNRIALGKMMARQIAARLEAVDETWVVVPVPLHRWRVWRRGFNQAAIIAGEIACRTGATLCVDALERRKSTPMLGGYGANERRRILSQAFAVRPSRAQLVRNARILLVDDVLTSGATSDACIAALKGAGAGIVMVGCFSRVLDEFIEPV